MDTNENERTTELTKTMFCLFLICECGLQTQHPNQNEFTPKPSFVPQSSFSPFGEFEMSEHNIIVAKKYINIFRTRKKPESI